MRTINHIVLSAMLLLLSCKAIAVDFESRIRGDIFEHINVVEYSSYMTTASWNLAHGLPTADSIVIGNPVNAGEVIRLHFTNGINSVRVDHVMLGMEYLFAQEFTRVEAVDGSASTAGSGREIRTIGTGLSNRIYHFENTTIPFTHFRPLLKKRDGTSVASLFKNAKVPKGIYRAEINTSFIYDYVRNGVRIKQVVPITTKLTYNYNPAIINSVNIISGNGVIEPRYYGYPEKLVGGETNYQLQVLGDFQSGLKMGLRSSKHLDGLFALRPTEATTHNSDTKITYNVRCTNGCDGNGEIIRDGQAMIDDSNNRIDILPLDPTQSATIGININFGNKPLVDTPNGLYQDSFVLVFETLI